MKVRALRMFAEHVGDSASKTAAVEAIAPKTGAWRATLSRWVAQVEVDEGRRPGTTTEEAEEISRLLVPASPCTQ